MIGSLTVAALAGISAGVLLGLILIVTGMCVRAEIHRKCAKCLRNFFSISTKYEDLDTTAGETPEDSVQRLRPLGSCPEDLAISTESINRASENKDFSGNPCMLQFSLFNNYHTDRLYIHIICALNVPALTGRWFGRSPKTQIRFQLLPDIDKMYNTEIQARGSQPIFNETFEFVGYSPRELLDLTLRLGIYVYDKFSRGKLLGYTSVPFDTIDWDPLNVTILWRCMWSLSTRRQRCSSFGRARLLHVSLRYEEQASRISVIILKGSNLTRHSKIKIIAPYVQVMLSIDNKVLETQQTKRKRTANPVWNKGFLFDVNSNRIQDYSVTIRVMNYDLLLSDEEIGKIVFSARADGSGREHWDEMMKRKNIRRETAVCHQLH